jgi:hypothetical protein
VAPNLLPLTRIAHRPQAVGREVDWRAAVRAVVTGAARVGLIGVGVAVVDAGPQLAGVVTAGTLAFVAVATSWGR